MGTHPPAGRLVRHYLVTIGAFWTKLRRILAHEQGHRPAEGGDDGCAMDAPAVYPPPAGGGTKFLNDNGPGTWLVASAGTGGTPSAPSRVRELASPGWGSKRPKSTWGHEP